MGPGQPLFPRPGASPVNGRRILTAGEGSHPDPSRAERGRRAAGRGGSACRPFGARPPGLPPAPLGLPPACRPPPAPLGPLPALAWPAACPGACYPSRSACCLPGPPSTSPVPAVGRGCGSGAGHRPPGEWSPDRTCAPTGPHARGPVERKAWPARRPGGTACRVGVPRRVPRRGRRVRQAARPAGGSLPVRSHLPGRRLSPHGGPLLPHRDATAIPSRGPETARDRAA